MSEEQKLEETISAIKKLVDEHADKQGYLYSYPLDQQVKAVIRKYEDVATRNLAGVKAFRDEVIVMLRALSLIAETVGNAGTHREKEARVRGLVELLESSIKRLAEADFTFQRSYWNMPNVFRSDYPIHQYIEKIYKLEAEIARLTGKVAPNTVLEGESPF